MVKIFFFFKHLDFSENWPEFPLFVRLSKIYKNLMKAFKYTSKLQIFNFHIRTPRPQPNQTQ